jgi:hypothetical protein
MMNEYATIKIERFRDPDGHSTCAIKTERCEFLMNNGKYAVCFFGNQDLYRNNNGTGFLQPQYQCPVWIKE